MLGSVLCAYVKRALGIEENEQVSINPKEHGFLRMLTQPGGGQVPTKTKGGGDTPQQTPKIKTTWGVSNHQTKDPPPNLGEQGLRKEKEKATPKNEDDLMDSLNSEDDLACSLVYDDVMTKYEPETKPEPENEPGCDNVSHVEVQGCAPPTPKPKPKPGRGRSKIKTSAVDKKCGARLKSWLLASAPRASAPRAGRESDHEPNPGETRACVAECVRVGRECATHHCGMTRIVTRRVTKVESSEREVSKCSWVCGAESSPVLCQNDRGINFRKIGLRNTDRILNYQISQSAVKRSRK